MICTTLEQSKKLVELGIDTSTADMFYCNGLNLKTKDWEYDLTIIDENFKPDIGDIPAWSTEALMKLLPAEFTSVGEYSTTTYEIDIRKYKLTEDVDLYQIAYGSRSFVDGIEHWKDMINTGEKESLLDAAFDMVCWLKENKKLLELGFDVNTSDLYQQYLDEVSSFERYGSKNVITFDEWKWLKSTIENTRPICESELNSYKELLGHTTQDVDTLE